MREGIDWIIRGLRDEMTRASRHPEESGDYVKPDIIEPVCNFINSLDPEIIRSISKCYTNPAPGDSIHFLWDTDDVVCHLDAGKDFFSYSISIVKGPGRLKEITHERRVFYRFKENIDTFNYCMVAFHKSSNKVYQVIRSTNSRFETISTHQTKKGAYQSMRRWINEEYMSWYNERLMVGKEFYMKVPYFNRIFVAEKPLFN